MLRPNPTSIESDDGRPVPPVPAVSPPAPDLPKVAPGIDIQRELNYLEEIILGSPEIPWIGRTLVDEEKLLDQLDMVRLNLPVAFQEAEVIVRHKEEIIREAQLYAEEVITAAEERAAQILNEMGLVQQAKQESDQLRQQVQMECDLLQQTTISEMEQVRYQTRQELEELRSQTLADCQDIQQGADEYADHVLNSIEHQLADMLRVIRNGRQQLEADSVVQVQNQNQLHNQ
ncbi:MAG: DivIVA domain-containing protein [Microcoleaceae cyanobacterium]